MDTIKILGPSHSFVIDELRRILLDSTFLYEKEYALLNSMTVSFTELSFIALQYRTSHEEIIKNGTQGLTDYLDELNDATENPDLNYIVELHLHDLSAYYKTFLIMAKSVMDKLMPLYSYRYYCSLKQFSKKGGRLINSIKKNKRITCKEEFLALISQAKNDWIDSLIDLRDDYAHYSSLPQYRSFWISSSELGKKTLTGIQDFSNPEIMVGNKNYDALEYMLMVKENLIVFLHDFLVLCDFTPNRRPKHYLNCECGYVFAKRKNIGAEKGKLKMTSNSIKINVKNRELEYGVIVCPKCDENTDTDLQFWKKEGFIFNQ